MRERVDCFGEREIDFIEDMIESIYFLKGHERIYLTNGVP